MADTPRTHEALLKLLADNTSGAITPQVLRDLFVSLDDYPLNVRRFGAKGDGVTDDTAAIQAAIRESPTYPPERFRPVYFPPGNYLCHEVEWNGRTTLVGFEVGNSVLTYNGDGGPGSTVLFYADERPGATPWGGFSNLTIGGQASYSASSSKIAEHCFLRIGMTGTDWGTKFENLYFLHCFGDAIDFGSSEIVNIHMNRIRFDSIGGFCIRFSANDRHESRPVNINQFTVDNNPHRYSFAEAAKSQGYYDGTHWGKGFLLLEDTGGVHFNISDGRIELNVPLLLHDTRKAMIFVNQTFDGGNTSVRLENVHGYFRPTDAGVGVFAKEGRTNFTAAASQIRDSVALFEDYPAKKRISEMAHDVVYRTNNQQSKGIHLQTSQIEVRDELPNHTVYNVYKRGDVIFAEKVSSGGPLGWVCVDKDDHWRAPSRPIYKGAVSFTAGSNEITVIVLNDMHLFMPGLAITLAGAGAAGADLDTFITEVSGEKHAFTVNDAPATSAELADVKVPAPSFEPFGIVGAVQAEPLRDSAAKDIEGLVGDFNALLDRLRKAKLLRP